MASGQDQRWHRLIDEHFERKATSAINAEAAPIPEAEPRSLARELWDNLRLVIAFLAAVLGALASALMHNDLWATLAFLGLAALCVGLFLGFRWFRREVEDLTQ